MYLNSSVFACIVLILFYSRSFTPEIPNKFMPFSSAINWSIFFFSISSFCLSSLRCSSSCFCLQPQGNIERIQLDSQFNPFYKNIMQHHSFSKLFPCLAFVQGNVTDPDPHCEFLDSRSVRRVFKYRDPDYDPQYTIRIRISNTAEK